MGTTRIFVTKDAALAATTAGFWENEPEQYKVLAIGPTDTVRVEEADQTAVHWVGDSGPWYAVVVTLDAPARAQASAG